MLHRAEPLNLKGISNQGYEHSQQLCYFVAADVLVLADVFETCRNTCFKRCNLDLKHFSTTQGLAWQAALKYTGIKFELLRDYNMLLTFENGIQGGITQAVYQYGSKKYIKEIHNPVEENTEIRGQPAIWMVYDQSIGYKHF